MIKNSFLISFTVFIFLSFIGGQTAYSAEGDTYSFSWLDPDKEVFVLQNRKYRKKGKFHFNAGYGITTNGAFVNSTLIQGRVGYFFLEEWGFEAIYAKHSGEENDTAKSVRQTTVPFRRIVDGYRGAMILWSPFYAKINTFNKIIYVDWMLGLGMAELEEMNNHLTVLNSINTEASTEIHNGLLWDTALKFFLDENWEIRVDLTVVHYKAKQATVEAKEEWYSNWDASLSLGLSF